MVASLTKRRRKVVIAVGAALVGCVLLRLYGIPMAPGILSVSENHAVARLIASPAGALFGFRVTKRYPDGQRRAVHHVRLPELDWERTHIISASFYSPDGTLASRIRNGHGTASYYHENGTLAKLELFLDDVTYLCMLWDREGRLKHYRRHTPGNMADFVALSWHADGGRESEQRMAGGQGCRRHWSVNGNLVVVYRSLSASHAIYERYDEDENVVLREHHENSRTVSREYFDEHGNVSRRLTADEIQAEDGTAAAVSID